MEFNYVSLVGTQVMAVLNPLFALISGDNKISRVLLFPTEKTKEKAGRIKKYLTNVAACDSNNIIIAEVTDDMIKNDHIDGTIKGLLTKNVDDNLIVFNLAGGMNYQIVSFVNAMKNFDHIGVLYPDLDHVYGIFMKKGNVEKVFTADLPDKIKIEDILELQGVKFKNETRPNPSGLLDTALRISGSSLPKDGLKNVSIGGVYFDFIWNHNNTLNYITSIKGSQNDVLEDNIIRLAKGRSAFGELYHRGITVLTSNKKTCAKINETGGGKVNAICCSQSASDQVKREMTRIFQKPSRPLKKGGGAVKETVKIKKGQSAQGTLMVILGRDIQPTMIACWSHQPRHALILYTNEDSQVMRLKNAMIKHKQKILLETMSFIPITMFGDDILSIKTHGGQSVAVNITPGTKSQGTFLSVWAGMNSAKVYSLVTPKQRLMEIPSNDTGICLKGPSPVTLLELNGYNVMKSFTRDENYLQKNEHTYDLLKKFMINMLKENVDISRFMNETIKLNTGNTIVRCDDKNAILKVNGKDTNLYIANGQWLEDFVGYMLIKAGAENVNTRIRIAWDEESQKALSEKYQNESMDENNRANKKFPRNPGSFHMEDIDVAGRVNGNYYVITCKSGSTKHLSQYKTKVEVEHTASLFGRFTIPLMCFLKHQGEPYKTGDVYVFGYKTLIDTDEFKNLIKKATNERRKTT